MSAAVHQHTVDDGHVSAEKILRRSLIAPVYEVARKTPLQQACLLSERFGCQVYLKREDLQPVYSFKCRGAHASIRANESQARHSGVITASAGNHAQGVALSASKLGIRATIVMPESTPEIKVDAVRRMQADVILHGEHFDAASAHALKLSEQGGQLFVHPFDDPDVIAGQGTIAIELGQQWPTVPDAIMVPVGGGGLLAGIASVIKCLYPKVRIIGVEPDDAACLTAALSCGKPVELSHVGRFADGAAVKVVGHHSFRLLSDLVDEVITVSADEICAAVRDIYEDTRSLVEPAGALAVAGIKKWLPDQTGMSNVIGINSGANVNFDRLGHFVERSVYGEQNEILLSVEIEETPGSFLRFCKLLGDCRITEFNYRFRSLQAAQVYVGIRMDACTADRGTLISQLRDHGHRVSDLTSSELARFHLRHLVGGIMPLQDQDVSRECFYRFDFPEQPQALMRFLEKLAGRWNISLFHYSNHGAVSTRVFVGFMVPDDDRLAFERFIRGTGYNWCDESNNPDILPFLK